MTTRINHHTAVFVIDYCVNIITSWARNRRDMYVFSLVRVSLFLLLTRTAANYKVVQFATGSAYFTHCKTISTNKSSTDCPWRCSCAQKSDARFHKLIGAGAYLLANFSRRILKSLRSSSSKAENQVLAALRISSANKATVAGSKSCLNVTYRTKYASHSFASSKPVP